MHVIMRSLISYLIIIEEGLDIVYTWVKKSTCELVVRHPAIVIEAKFSV